MFIVFTEVFWSALSLLASISFSSAHAAPPAYRSKPDSHPPAASKRNTDPRAASARSQNPSSAASHLVDNRRQHLHLRKILRRISILRRNIRPRLRTMRILQPAIRIRDLRRHTRVGALVLIHNRIGLHRRRIRQRDSVPAMNLRASPPSHPTTPLPLHKKHCPHSSLPIGHDLF